jgi:hypothetical protein
MGTLATDTLAFEMRLTESFTSKLAPVTRELGKFDNQLAQTKRNVGAFGSSLNLGGLDFGALGNGGRFFTFDLASGLGLVVGAVEKVIGAFASLTKSIVKTAAEAQDLNLAVELNVGKERAAEIQALADNISNTTRFDDDDVKRAILPLLDIGVSDTKLLDNLVTAAADIAARRGEGVDGLNSALASFQKLALKGEVDAKALRQLGIGEASFFANLADLMKISKEQAEALTKVGKVSADTLISVALDEIARREGGAIGPGAVRAAETLGGTLAKLGNATGNMFKQIADGDGMKAVQAALSRIVTVLTGPAGKRFVDSIDKLLAKLGDVITPDRIEGFLTAIGDGITWVVDKLTGTQPGDLSWLDKFVIGVQASIKVLGVLWDVISAVGGAIGWLVENFVGLFTWMSEIGDSILESTSGIGANIWKGLVDGITGGVDAVKGAITGLGEGALSSLKSLLGIASPSKVMAALGLNTAEGFAVGLEQGESEVEQATRRTIADTVMQPVDAQVAARATTPTGAPIQVNVEVNITAPTSDAGELSRIARQAVREGVIEALDEVGFSTGAALAEAA